MHWKNLARPFFLALLVSATSRAQVPAGHFLTVDSSRIYFEECGTGPAVVLLHDGLVHAVTWDPVWNALCARFHVLRYDRRGMGRSTAPKVPFIPTEDLTALLADRKIQSATLVGSSSGAGLALDFAIRHPDKVDRLVLLGPVVHGMATSTHFLERGERNNAPLATGDTRAAARNWADDRYQIAPGHDAARNALFDALASSPQNLTYPGNLELHFAVPAAARLGEIRAPTLILVGASDIADVQAYAGAVELGVWGARREVVANSGHLIQLEWPDFVVDAVTRFINEHPVVTIAAGTLASYAGTYDTLMYGRSGDFYVKDNRLYVKILTERDLPLFPSSDSTFYTLGRDGLNFRFTKDAQGAPTGVEAGTRDGKHFATRAKPPAAPPARPDSVKEEPARTAPGLSLRPCAVPPNDGAGQCGTFDVFEDRGARTGRKIALRIVLLPALNARHAPDPVFWLAGGPGAASTANVFAAKGGFLAGLRAEHDIVFVDQRGTGHSNPLNCDIGDDPGNLDAYFGKLMPSAIVAACRKTLEPVANLAMYTTSNAMDDLDDVRAALGYDKINIVAASYGTIAAQVYLRRHGEHARSEFLVGVATPGIKQPLPFARGAQAALDSLYVDCASDPGCRAAYPNLKREFGAVLARFDKGSLSVRMIDPATSAARTVVLERENFVERIRLLLYTTTFARFVPFVVHKAFEGDFVPFETMSTQYNPGATLSRGVYMTVTCAESVPFISDREREEQTRGTFVGDRRVRAHQTACTEWPRAEVSRDFIEPVRSSVPVLMFSGGVDGSTPSWLGSDAVRYLSHGRQIYARYAGHQLDNECVGPLIDAFIASARADGIDASCAAKIRRPSFATELPFKSP